MVIVVGGSVALINKCHMPASKKHRHVTSPACRPTSSTRSMTSLAWTTAWTQSGPTCSASHQSTWRPCACHACAAAPCPPAHAWAARVGPWAWAASQQRWQPSCSSSSIGRPQGARRRRGEARAGAQGVLRCRGGHRGRCSSCTGTWPTQIVTMKASVRVTLVSLC